MFLGLLLIHEIYFGSGNASKVYSIDAMAKELKNSYDDHILEKIISLEYEARELNKGLLLRASLQTAFQVSVGSAPSMQTLAGTTVWSDEKSRVEQSYRKKATKFYSISFGNSLFAGFFLDLGACVYNYLVSFANTGIKFPGYALFIDKKDYIQHQNSRLFFISALSPIASLFAKGEWFHSRSTVAVPVKSAYSESSIIQGLVQPMLKDDAGLFLISRDPLYHAELSSQFIAQNGSIDSGWR